jgi:SAM-dependent MidA family methyltransferase
MNRYHRALENAKASASQLPEPGEVEREHSATLQTLIRQTIDEAGGQITFEQFMDLALHAPGLGYYSSHKIKFGEQGDFVTAPEISPLFGQCLANQCQQILTQVIAGSLLEVGAGRGLLAGHILQHLQQLDALPVEYLILETSGDLCEQQQQHLHQTIPELDNRIRWLNHLPEDFRGVIVANELLDAMPVQRFLQSDDGLKQLGVEIVDDGFDYCLMDADEALQQRITPLSLAQGYSSEVNFQAESWIGSMADVLQRGVMLLIDYGFPRHEFYHPQRQQGTLMCHYRHRAHDNPFTHIGLQDITAHVDFTAMAEAASTAGLDVLGYTNQASFLISNGLEQLLNASDPDNVKAHLAMTQQVKTLTMPSEMGELFKVIALGKDMDIALQGFALQDQRGRL